MVPSTREELKNYVLRKLGQPVIQVNVAVEQLDDRIDEALLKYYEKNFNATDVGYLIHNITDADIAQGYIDLPPDVVAVTDLMRPSITNTENLFSIDYQLTLSELYTISSPYLYGDMTYYYMNRTHLDLLNYFFSPDVSYTFNPNTGRLTMSGLKSIKNTNGFVILKTFRKIYGEAPRDDSNALVANIWKDKWLQDYATALVKRQWAQNLSKYQQIQLLGGVTMNGQQMMEEAMDDIERLEQQLELEFMEPLGFFVG